MENFLDTIKGYATFVVILLLLLVASLLMICGYGFAVVWLVHTLS